MAEGRSEGREAFERELARANAWRAEKGHSSGYFTWSGICNMLAEYGQAATAAERARCAKIAEDMGWVYNPIADAIRKGETK